MMMMIVLLYFSYADTNKFTNEILVIRLTFISMVVFCISVMLIQTKSLMRLALDKKPLDSQRSLFISRNLQHFTKLSQNILLCILCKYKITLIIIIELLTHISLASFL